MSGTTERSAFMLRSIHPKAKKVTTFFAHAQRHWRSRSTYRHSIEWSREVKALVGVGSDNPHVRLGFRFIIDEARRDGFLVTRRK